MSKLIIYKSLGTYCVTPEENYNAYIQDARAISKCPGFKSAQEVIDYYAKYNWAKPDDFIVKEV